MQERCGYRSKQGLCGSPSYASKTVRVLVDGQWVKRSIVVCKDHSYKRRVNQKTNVKKCDPCGESSLYWNWVGEKTGQEGDFFGEFTEDERANPDKLSENEGLWARARLSDEDQDVADEAIKAAETVLTPRQKEVFELLVYERRNSMEIAAKLRVSHQTVSQHIGAIIKKIQEHTCGNRDS